MATLEQELADLPDPPVNVRLVHPDGRIVPLELLYRGRCGCGNALWMAPRPVWVGDLHPDAMPVLRFDHIPGGSHLAVPWMGRRAHHHRP